MNDFRRNKKLMKVLSFIIMLSMIFGLVPAAYAAPAEAPAVTAGDTGTILPSDHFKFVKLNSANTYYQAAWFKDNGMTNYVQKPINLGDWALLTFAIQFTQHIKIKVYEVDPSQYTWNDPEGVKLLYNEDPSVLEPWLTDENFRGYLKGYRIDDNIDFKEDGSIAYKPVPADLMQVRMNSYIFADHEDDFMAAHAVEFTPAPEDPDKNLAYGFTGQSLMAALTARFEAFAGLQNENEIIALLNGQEPAAEKQPQSEKELEPEKKPVPEPEKETPAEKPDENTEDVTQPEGEGTNAPDANAGDKAEGTTPEEQPENPEGTPAENPDPAPVPETDQQQSENFEGQDVEPKAMDGAAGEEQPPVVEPEPEPEQTPTEDTTTDPVDPQPEEEVLPEEEITPAAHPANLPTDEEIIEFLQQAGLTGEVSPIMPLADGDYGEEYEGYIHNLIMWHGQVVDEEGNVTDLPMVNDDEEHTSKYYCLVTEPVLPHLAQYNSFLVFQGSELPSAELGQAEFNELFKVKLLDPVDILTGSFSNGYTDIAVHGKDDLEFTRLYESKYADEVGPLGAGWLDNYSYQVNIADLYAEAVFPGSEKLYFELQFDGTYQARAGSAFTFAEGGSGYVLTHKDGTVYDFNADGTIASISYPQNNTLTFTYNDQGQRTSVSNASGTLSFAYDADGKLVTVSDENGRTVNLSYNGDQLISAQNTDSDSLNYEYDSTNNIVKVTDFNGNIKLTNTFDDKNRVVSQYIQGEGTYTFTYDEENHTNACTGPNGYYYSVIYDELGRITSATDSKGTESFEYNDKNQRTAYTDRLGNTTRYEHDEAGNVSAITYPNGATEYYTYNDMALPLTMKDRNGNTVTKTYDEYGNCITETDRRGNTTTYAYDAMGNCVSITNALGQVTTNTYDIKGNRVTSTDPLGNVTKYEYDEQGRVTSLVDEKGYTVTFEYTSAGKLVKVTDPQGNTQNYMVDGNGFSTTESDWIGNITTTVYNENNKPLSITTPMGFTTNYSYDEAGNMTTVTDALGNTVTYNYDAEGLLVSMTDARGGTYHYTYDANGQLVSIVDGENSITSTNYNDMGQIASITNGRSNTTRYGYDANGNVITVTDAAGNSVTTTYDANGNVVSTRDHNGNVTKYEYDANNQLVKETDALGNSTTYSYDADGNLVKTVTPMGNANNYTYDERGQMVSEADPLNHVTGYTYDELGRVITTTFADGTTNSFTYDANGRLLTTTDEIGVTISYVYDKDGRLISFTNGRGYSTTYTYDAVGNMTATTDALDGVTSKTYDANGNLTSETNALGNTTKYTYDKMDRVKTVTDPLGNVSMVDYDANGNIVKVTDVRGGVTSYTYDSLDRLTSYTDQEGYTFSFAYDANGNLIKETDGNGNVTGYSYDALNRNVAMTNAEGNVSTTAYDADGNLTKLVDEEGAQTSYTYDADGKVIKITDALGNSTTLAYDERERLISATDAKGGVTSYTYTDRGEVAAVTDAEGYVTSYTYDENGNCITMTTPDGLTTFEYDALDRLTKKTTPSGASQTFTYDAIGQITSVTDANGNTSRYVYDANGNLIETIDPLNHSSYFAYDAAGNITKVTLNRIDEQDKVNEQEITLYEYDGRNLVTKTINAAGETATYTYDGNGNMVAKTDEDGYVTTYTYNSMDWVSAINYNDSKTVTYAYNKVGELVKMDDWLGTTSFEVDLLKRLQSVTDHKGRKVGYEYDSVSNQTAIHYPDETTVSYDYDLVHNMKTVTESNNGNVTHYTYDGMRRVVNQTYPNGWVAENEYDNEGRVVKVWDIDPSQKDLKTIKHTYTYDPVGNMLTEYKRGNGQGQAKEDWAYQYDALNRLTQAHENHGNETRNYQYDSLGNLTYEWNSNNVLVDYKLNNLNQITQKTDDGWKTWTDYSYDKRGNTIQKIYNKNKKHTVIGNYVYDETNRMTQGTNDIGEQSTYHFNGLGVLVTNEWLIKKNAYGYHDVTAATVLDPGEELVIEPTTGEKKAKGKKKPEEVAVDPELNKTSHVIKDFVIDYNSEAQENLMEYELYDEGLTYRYVYGEDKLLGVTVYPIPNGSASITTPEQTIPLYYHMDHMGSSEFLTSDVTQRVTSWTSYDEWGNITHNAVLKCGYRELDLVKNYTGHERDSVLGMYYAKARLYDTADKHGSTKGNKLGDKRFMAVDPVKGDTRNPQSMVQYTYTLNNPLMYVDPLGEYYVFAAEDNDGKIHYFPLAENRNWTLFASLIETYGNFSEWGRFGTEAIRITEVLGGSKGGNSERTFKMENTAANVTMTILDEQYDQTLEAIPRYFDQMGGKVLVKLGKGIKVLNSIYLATDFINRYVDRMNEIVYYDEVIMQLLELSGINYIADTPEEVERFMSRAYEFIEKKKAYFFGHNDYYEKCSCYNFNLAVSMGDSATREEIENTPFGWLDIPEGVNMWNFDYKLYSGRLKGDGFTKDQEQLKQTYLEHHKTGIDSRVEDILNEFAQYLGLKQF